jgi:hypothetical protein
LKRGETVLFDEETTPDSVKGNRIATASPGGKSGEPVRLTIRTADGRELISAETTTK